MWKDRWKARDLLADERSVRPVLDFLSTTDVGRLAPPLEEADKWAKVGAEEPGSRGVENLAPMPR